MPFWLMGSPKERVNLIQAIKDGIDVHGQG